MNSARDIEDPASELIALIRELAVEVHPRQFSDRPVELDDSIDHDLGLDSLSRVELLGRIEARFELVLPERVFSDAETPRDLLRAILGAEKRSGGVAKPDGREIHASALPMGLEEVPRHAETLVEVLDWHARSHPDRPHIQFAADAGEGESLSYGRLRDLASSVAAGLRRLDLQPGEPVAVILPTGQEYFATFFGILVAGGIPVPIYPPIRWSRMEQHLKRHRPVIENCGAKILVTDPEAKTLAAVFKSQVAALDHIVTTGELTSEAGTGEYSDVAGGDTAFLQYTSGSTGNPKGVVITHANLLANIRAMGEALEVGSTDVFVSWLPLYHDMGLIGAWLGSLYHGALFVILSPMAFLAKPQRWLWAIHRYRGTISPAPNFGYELCLRRVRKDDIAGLDLGSWRVALNGAEPVSPSTIRRFGERFAGYGLRKEALMPVYGLAECSVGLAFPPVDRGPLIERIQRERFEREGKAMPTGEGNPLVHEFVACGRPLKGHEIRVVDEAGRELPERREGKVEFRGPSATSGYFRNPDATRELFRGEWLATGDLGYIASGDLYVTGRTKDIIIRAGRNIYPHEIEEAVGGIDGIYTGNVAVFGCEEPETGTTRLIVVAETRKREAAAVESLRSRVNEVCGEILGTPPDAVILAPPRSVLKTSSGKVRRAACRELYSRGEIGKADPAGWRYRLHFVFSTVRPILTRARSAVSEFLYATVCWTFFGALAPVVWTGIVLLPRPSWRWRLIRCAGGILRKALRIPISARGLEHIPRDRTSVLVCNHASYLDGYILATILPVEIKFIAKSELKANAFIRIFLTRLGTEYVERFDREKGLDDARRIGRTIDRDRFLLYFPEGTFTRSPGLLPFHLGGFSAAADAGLPVVPIAIRGTRSILRADSWFPRRGSIAINVGKPISGDNETAEKTEDSQWAKALRLRAAAREHILRYCGEPDLANERSPI